MDTAPAPGHFYMTPADLEADLGDAGATARYMAEFALSSAMHASPADLEHDPELKSYVDECLERGAAADKAKLG